MSLANTRDLTDVQWKMLDDLIPEPIHRRDGRGWPWKDRRAVLNGILWVLRTGAPLADVPERYPSYQTCHRRFQQWVRSGVMRGVRKKEEGQGRDQEGREGSQGRWPGVVTTDLVRRPEAIRAFFVANCGLRGNGRARA
jgi:transposase